MPVNARCGVVVVCTAALLAVISPAPAGAQVLGGATTVVVTITDSQLTAVPVYVPTGTVVFKVVNRGTVARDFKVGGKRTPKIAAGKSAVLSVDVNTEHNYPFYSAAPRHATLSGVIVVVPSGCPAPEATTILVTMAEAPIKMSQTRVHCGTVKFVVRNAGAEMHQLIVRGVGSELTAPGGAGPQLKPGQTVTLTVHFGEAGSAYYYCAVDDHDDVHAERGFLVVY
jgi:uncharacterized cupredoxin-like copper-binding protein